MKTNTNNIMKPRFCPQRWRVAVVAFLLVGNLSPFGMRALDFLNVEPPLSDIVLTIVLFTIAGMIYRMICPKSPKWRKVI